MTTTEQNIALAEVCGTHKAKLLLPPSRNVPVYRLTDKNGKEGDFWENGSGTDIDFIHPAKYTEDLNACHSAEAMLLTDERCQRHLENLVIATKATLSTNGIPYGANYFCLYNANAAQRAEALCRTLWPERFNK